MSNDGLQYPADVKFMQLSINEDQINDCTKHKFYFPAVGSRIAGMSVA